MLWKIIGGRRIYRTESGISVYDNYFFRWLKINSEALQTVINKFIPQKAALNYVQPLIFAAKQKPGNCCMLGLGGAGVAHALAPFVRDFTITAVELNPEIIYIAAHFFMTGKLPNLTIIHEDASSFVSHNNQQYNHILVDLFNAHAFPDACYNEAFFEHCRRMLLPGGILAVNLANREEHRPIFNLIKKQFAQSTLAIPVKGCANLIVMASKSNRVKNMLDLFTASNQLEQLSWSEKWGCIAKLKAK